MNPKLFQWQSLKTRVTLLTLAIFVMGIWSLAYYASRMLREDMERLLGEQQFSTASYIAAEVNEELDNRLRILARVGERVTPAILGNPAALQAFLEERLILQDPFNGGVFACRLDGTAIAGLPRTAGRVGINYMDVDAVAVALREGKSTVSRPLVGKTLRAPIFDMSVPIRNAQGKVIGALTGATDLSRPNFLDKITESRYGKTGGYILIAAQQRLIVTATDKSRIMQSLAAPGVIPQTDRFVQGFEGYAVYVNPRGQEVLNSSKRIPVAGWNMAVTIPTAEAFAPIRAMQQRTLLATIFLTLLAGCLTWWMLRRQLAPMLAAMKTMAALSNSSQPPQPLPVTSQDEIGALINGFNRLLETLQQREYDYHSLVNNVPDYVMRYDRRHRHIFANDGCLRSTGLAKDEFIGKTHRELGFPEHLCLLWEKAIDRCFETKQPQSEIFAWESALGPVVLEWRAIPEVNEDGSIETVLGISRDITERKHLEDEVRQLAFHDALTRLPNRRLLNDRLGQAMAAGKRSGSYGAMMFLDLDNFKLLNDTHGHEVGDLLLIEAADRLKGCVREVDTVARFGGDEFVVMIGELDADKSEAGTQAGIIAEKVRAALARPYVLPVRHEGAAQTTVEHRCTASVGVVLFGQQEASQDDILKWADTAMYQAKEAGGNRIQFHDSKAGETAKGAGPAC